MLTMATYDLGSKRIKKVRVEVTQYPGGVGLRFTDDPQGAELTVELKRTTAADLVRALKKAGITA